MRRRMGRDIGVIGCGYVGLVLGAGLAETGNRVMCGDIDKEKIEMLKAGKMPIYEPGLEEMVQRNKEKQRLFFTTDIPEVVKQSEVVFIAVGTPSNEDGSADVEHVLSCARVIAENMNGYKVVVVRSTVPVGTCERVKEIISGRTPYPFDCASSPEFLKEGDAVADMMRPDRIVVGVESERAQAILKDIFSPFVRSDNPIIFMKVRSSEMTKYAANAMLATRISFMNEIARLCDAVGADIEEVRRGIGADPRIGRKFLFAGVGFGGSCFPKDLRALLALGKKNQVDMKVIEAVEAVNKEQKEIFVKKVTQRFGEDLKDKVFCVWGLSFKPNTDDMREAPSVDIILTLTRRGAKVKAYDPVAIENARKVFMGVGGVKIIKDAYSAATGADALLLVTEWGEFRQPDIPRLKEVMRGRLIFDGRNVLPIEALQEAGFQVIGIGRGK
jgi:UDPglucose 6-dehydrogenase